MTRSLLTLGVLLVSFQLSCADENDEQDLPDAGVEACEPNGKICDSDEFCERSEGYCTKPGECRARPTACTKELNIVCGCNGETYSNPCLANAAGTSIDTMGECPPSQ